MAKKRTRQKKVVKSQPVEPIEEEKVKTKTKKLPLEYKKGVYNPAIEDIEEISQQRDGNSNSTDSSCCVICNNVELMRLMRSRHYKQALALAKSKEKISSLQ